MKSERAIISLDVTTGEAVLVPVGVDENVPVLAVNIVAVWLLKMKGSFYVWLSDSGDILSSGPSSLQYLSNLIVAMPNIVEPSEGPLTSTLIYGGVAGEGTVSEEYGDSLARRLARRLKCQVFLSEQLGKYHSMPEILLNIEKKLVEFLSSALAEVL